MWDLAVREEDYDAVDAMLNGAFANRLSIASTAS